MKTAAASRNSRIYIDDPPPSMPCFISHATKAAMMAVTGGEHPERVSDALVILRSEEVRCPSNASNSRTCVITHDRDMQHNAPPLSAHHMRNKSRKRQGMLFAVGAMICFWFRRRGFATARPYANISQQESGSPGSTAYVTQTTLRCAMCLQYTVITSSLKNVPR